jgi:1,4-dihydroxy-2-naphthoyl-CoA synthase
VQAVILTGAGEKAFCTGGDVKQRAETGDYGPTESGMFEIGNLHKLIRDIPKPVIAAVNGVAVGGGHVLHVLCDLSIASETARFGQAGPKVGSFDAGFGSAYLARVVGEKRAREIWYLCRMYDAATAERWGLVNEVVEPERLLPRAREIAARVAGFDPVAVGGGHVLHVLCDLSIASETARFGQAGPKVGSFDAGFGSAYLARVVGEKRAREIWYLCRVYDAATAERWGLVNAVVPADQLLAEAKKWAAEIAEKSPTALRFLKQSFNADTDHQAGLSNLAMSALDLFTASPEGLEGAAAFAQKRPADFVQHVNWH